MRSGMIMPETRFREVMQQVRSNVAGTQALVLIGPDGTVLDHFAADPAFDLDGFIHEHAMLLRIARSTSEDTGSGNLSEHISVSEHSIVVARCFGSDFYLVLVSDTQDQIGRARYEMKRAAWYLERTMR